VDQRRQAGGEDDAAFLPPLPLQRGTAVAELDRLQPREPVAAAGAAAADRHVVADQLAAAAGENRRAFDQACPVLLVAACGEPSDAPALRKHAAEDRGAAVASGIATRDGGFQIGCEETGAWSGVVGNGPQTVRSRLPARTKRWNRLLSWTSLDRKSTRLNSSH